MDAPAVEVAAVEERLGNPTDLDVPVRHQPPVPLQPDAPPFRPPVVGRAGELAPAHQRFPFRRLDLVLHHLHAVEPVLHVAAVHDDAGAVPLADGLRWMQRRRMQVVVVAGEVGARVEAVETDVG